MPTYEFRCPKGHEFEKFYRSIGTAPAEVHCPECGMLAERQLSGGAGLVFKGSGFYITDYGKDGKKDLRAAPVKSGSESSEKSDSAAKASESGGGATESKSTDSKSADSKTTAGAETKSSGSSAKSSGAGGSKPSVSKKKDSK